MRGLYVNFIVGLLIIGVFLFFFARTLRGVLTLVRPQSQPTAVVQIPKNTEANSLFKQIFQQAKRTFKTNVKNVARQSDKAVAVAKSVTAEPSITPSSFQEKITPHFAPQFMYINDEPLPELSNPSLSSQECQMLLNELSAARQNHSDLVNDIGALFNLQAQQQAIVVLTKSEKASYQNAATCRSLAQYRKRQQRIEQEEQNRLNDIFQHHISSFNSKSKSGSNEWNSFYKRVNDFRRAKN